MTILNADDKGNETVASPLSFPGTATLDEEFDPDLLNPNSVAFKERETSFCNEVSLLCHLRKDVILNTYIKKNLGFKYHFQTSHYNDDSYFSYRLAFVFDGDIGDI